MRFYVNVNNKTKFIRSNTSFYSQSKENSLINVQELFIAFTNRMVPLLVIYIYFL